MGHIINQENCSKGNSIFQQKTLNFLCKKVFTKMLNSEIIIFYIFPYTNMLLTKHCILNMVNLLIFKCKLEYR